MKPFTKMSSAIFALVCVAHATRLCIKCPITVSGWELPMWISALGAFVAGALSLLVWRESQGK